MTCSQTPNERVPSDKEEMSIYAHDDWGLASIKYQREVRHRSSEALLKMLSNPNNMKVKIEQLNTQQNDGPPLKPTPSTKSHVAYPLIKGKPETIVLYLTFHMNHGRFDPNAYRLMARVSSLKGGTPSRSHNCCPRTNISPRTIKEENGVPFLKIIMGLGIQLKSLCKLREWWRMSIR
ncbi:hypothetical protein H6P81_003498 [Aristolochia fimbriata]|uniref:Uncharacterized protein n=1 Tax=Aristolochia fimbriata TaxID=158543 RepID=A0AAV7FCR4_ARIFI|nr:hypothetical protein H6P81_003498 [Aristolochia fimbriata]